MLHFLGTRVADNPLIDICRVVTMVMSSIMCGASIGWLSARVNTLAERVYITLIGIFVLAQEVDQFGKPMLVWRMPYLSLLVIVGLYVLLKPRPH